MPEPLSQLVPEVMTHLQRDIKEKREVLKNGWREVIGEDLSTWSRPVWVSEGELLVEVDSTTVMDVLRYKADQIMEKVNEIMEDGRITSVRFRLGG